MTDTNPNVSPALDLGAQVVQLGQKVKIIRGVLQTRGDFNFDMASLRTQSALNVWPSPPTPVVARREGNVISVELDFGLRALPPSLDAADLTAAAPVFSIQGTFSIEYVLAEDAPESGQEALDAFGEINGRFNLTAYWREYAQSCFARAGLPAFEIPPFNAAKALATLRQHEAEKVKTNTGG